MTISLDEKGVAHINLAGKTQMPCWCGTSHLYTVEAEFKADAAMEAIDMDDLDAAIQGRVEGARRFGWRLMHRIFFYETPPCEEGQ